MLSDAFKRKGRLKEKTEKKTAATAIRPPKRKTKKKEEWGRKTADIGFANMGVGIQIDGHFMAIKTDKGIVGSSSQVLHRTHRHFLR